MIKADFHTHCRFSQDSNGAPVKMIESAIEQADVYQTINKNLAG